MKKVIVFISLLFLCSCADDNDKPKYNKNTKLPVNCRAYVEYAVQGFEQGEYGIEQMNNGLRRNCGYNGQIWKNNRHF